MTTLSTDPSPTPQMQIRQVVERLFRAVEEMDATSYLSATYHPEVIIHESPALPYGGDYRGVAGVREHARAFLATWGPHQSPADRAMHAQIDVVPDHAYVRWSLSVAGRRFDVISHYRFLDGRIVESRMFPFDVAGLLAWRQTLQAEAARPMGENALDAEGRPRPRG